MEYSAKQPTVPLVDCAPHDMSLRLTALRNDIVQRRHNVSADVWDYLYAVRVLHKCRLDNTTVGKKWSDTLISQGRDTMKDHKYYSILYAQTTWSKQFGSLPPWYDEALLHYTEPATLQECLDAYDTFLATETDKARQEKRIPMCGPESYTVPIEHTKHGTEGPQRANVSADAPDGSLSVTTSRWNMQQTSQQKAASAWDAIVRAQDHDAFSTSRMALMGHITMGQLADKTLRGLSTSDAVEALRYYYRSMETMEAIYNRYKGCMNIPSDDWESKSVKSVTSMDRIHKSLYLFRGHERVATALRDDLSRKEPATKRIACAIHRHKQLLETLERNPGSLLLHAMDAWADYEQRYPETDCRDTLYTLTHEWHRQNRFDEYVQPTNTPLDTRQQRQNPRNPDDWSTPTRQQSLSLATQGQTRFQTPEQQQGTLELLQNRDLVVRQLQMEREDVRDEDPHSDVSPGMRSTELLVTPTQTQSRHYGGAGGRTESRNGEAGDSRRR